MFGQAGVLALHQFLMFLVVVVLSVFLLFQNLVAFFATTKLLHQKG